MRLDAVQIARSLLRHKIARRLFRGVLRARRFARNSEIALVGLIALLAVGIGFVTAGLHLMIQLLHTWAFDLPPGVRLSAVPHDPSVRFLVVPVLGGVVLGFTRRLFKGQGIKQIVDPIEANALRGGQMSFRDSLRVAISTLTSNASGASVGMEAGYTQVGAAICSVFGRWMRLRRAEMRVFVSAGAAAAIAAAFNAPLAGAFYGFEVVHGRYTVRSLAPIALASLAAALMVRLLGVQPLFQVPQQTAPLDVWLYLAGVVLGIGAAYISILTMSAATAVERVFRNTQIPDWLRPALGAVVLSIIATASPQVLGSVQGAIAFHLSNNWPIAALIVLLFAKLFASSLSLGAGFRGGLFSCSLMLGCVYGGAFAALLQYIAPELAQYDIVFKLMGTAAVGAGIIGAPLTMSLLVLESTSNFNLAIAVVGGAAVASLLVRLRFGYSFATWRFHLRGLPISGAEDVGWLTDLRVERLTTSNPPVVLMEEPLASVRKRYPLGSTDQVYVVDGDGRYVGTINVHLVHTTDVDDASAAAIASDIASGRENFLTLREPVSSALNKFELWRSEHLAAVRSESDRTLVGSVSEANLLRRYAHELQRHSSQDLAAPPEPPPAT